MFTQKYIELAKNEKVQGLRTELEYFDMYCFISNQREFKVYGYDIISERNKLIWLPTGDQIDACILDICKKNEWSYRIDVDDVRGYETVCEIFDYNETEPEWIGKVDTQNADPLIAKLKLLISLLEAQDE